MTLVEANSAVAKLWEDLLKAVDPILFNFMDSTSVPLENVFLGFAVQMWPNNLGAETRLSAPLLFAFRSVGCQSVEVADANGVEFGRFLRANIEHSTLYGAVLQGLTRAPE